MKIARYFLKDRFSFFDVIASGLVVGAVMHGYYLTAAVIFVAGAWLSGLLVSATKAT